MLYYLCSSQILRLYFVIVEGDKVIYSYTPSLDLHGETSSIAEVLVNQFISDNYKLSNSTVIIVHGIGKGIIKNTVHNTLKKNKLVKSYKIDNFNVGCTIVNLIDKN